MISIEKARKLRKMIVKASASLEDEDALEAVELFPLWAEGVVYSIGDRVRYNNELYKCVQDHTSRDDWNPVDAVSLWAKVLIPDPEVIPEWVQPESTNAYMKDDKVRHINKIWVSLIDYNVYEPGTVGTENIWREVVD